MAKKKTTKKKAEPATVESIMKECEKEVRKGLGSKKLSAGALQYWTTVYAESIDKQLKKGGNWESDKTRVLPVARKLGKVAAALTSKGMVLKWAAEAAAVAVMADPGCPVGGGGYCEI
jgi:hypothetical protein